MKARHRESKPVATSEAANLSPATPDQIAEMDRILQQIRLDAAEANQPYGIVFVIALTSLAFSFLLVRKDALFHQNYLDLLTKLAKNFVPFELTEGASAKIEANVGDHLVVLQKECLDYHDMGEHYLKLAKTSFPDVYSHFGPDRMVKAFFNKHYSKNDAADTIRNNCLKFCNSVFNKINPDSFAETQKKLIGSDTTLEGLDIYQLFQATRRIVDFVKHDSSILNKNRRALGDIYARLLAYEQKSSIINLAKIGVIGIAQNAAGKAINFIRPYGIQQKQLQLAHDRSLLSEAKAATYLQVLNTDAKNIKRVAERNTRYTIKAYLALAFLAFSLMLISNLGGLPGELAFFMVAVASSGLYQLTSHGIKKLNHHWLDSYIKSAQDAFDKNFKDVFILTVHSKQKSLELVQFNIQYKYSYKDINLEDMRLVLNCCLKNHDVKVISGETWPFIIAYNKNITEKNMAKIKLHFDDCITHIVKINELSKKLTNIKNTFSSEKGYFSCEKSFNAQGYADAVWHFLSNSAEHAIRLQTLLGDKNCTWHKQPDNTVVINIHNVACLRNLDLQQALPLSNPKPELESELEPTTEPSSGRTTLKHPPVPKTKNTGKNSSGSSQNPEETATLEQKKHILERLPAPYQDARRIKAPFLPADAHVWALFQATKGNFPDDKCYEKFKEICEKAEIVPNERFQGLVHDPSRSTPTDQRLKGKSLGTYGMFGVKGPVVDVTIKISDEGNPEIVPNQSSVNKKQKNIQIEKIHIFNEVFMRH